MMTMNHNFKHDHHFEKVKHPHEMPKVKGVSAEPHPMDRHSGMAFRSHDRKGGAGKFNIGNVNDELKMESFEVSENYNENWRQDMKMHKMDQDSSIALHTYMKMHNMPMEAQHAENQSDEVHKREPGVPSHGLNLQTDHPELLNINKNLKQHRECAHKECNESLVSHGFMCDYDKSFPKLC